ncbi:SRPBCC family protein [Gordonia sp. CPCC 205333]|uniref:SRPBCC family protein n=1 Tax=Gordonia sp. CPCC 205333 TaxID=3140790 RepID=UPI003AF3BC0A
MTVISRQVVASAPRELAFAHVNNYKSVPTWMFGVTKFTPLTDQTEGLDSTFDAVMKIGPKSLHSTLKTTEWVENELIKLESVDGISAATTWRFADAEGGGTAVDVEFTYNLPGGLAGRALAAIVEPVVGQAIRSTETTLTKQVESAAAATED